MAAANVIDPAGPSLLGIGSEVGVSSGGFVFNTGDNTQASFITPLSEAGTLNANSWAATDLTIDVIGYFTAPTRTYRYTYDTTGLRASKSLDDEGVTGQGWTKEFTWDTSGGLPLLLAEHRGSQTSYVVYGPQGTPIYQVTGTGDVMYFHQDHLSSIRLVTNANGTIKGTLTYNAYGKPKTNTIGWLQEQPLLGYNSQYHDPETGYIYLRARHYDPTTSQFTTVDPLVAMTDQPYGYVGGDPGNWADPTGLLGGPSSPVAILVAVQNYGNIERLTRQVGSYTCEHYDRDEVPGCADTGTINAIRHFLGSLFLTYIFVSTYGGSLGTQAASFVLQGHEFEGLCSGIVDRFDGERFSRRDALADQDNNALGMIYGQILAFRVDIDHIVDAATRLAEELLRAGRLNTDGGLAGGS